MCSQCYEEFENGLDYRMHWEEKHFYPYVRKNSFDYEKAKKDLKRELEFCDVSGGQTGNNDMPGRLMFFTTADGAQVPTERIRITSEGYSKHSNDGTYDTYTHAIQAHQFRQSLNKPTLWLSLIHI